CPRRPLERKRTLARRSVVERAERAKIRIRAEFDVRLVFRAREDGTVFVLAAVRNFHRRARAGGEADGRLRNDGRSVGGMERDRDVAGRFFSADAAAGREGEFFGNDGGEGGGI